MLENIKQHANSGHAYRIDFGYALKNAYIEEANQIIPLITTLDDFETAFLSYPVECLALNDEKLFDFYRLLLDEKKAKGEFLICSQTRVCQKANNDGAFCS